MRPVFDSDSQNGVRHLIPPVAPVMVRSLSLNGHRIESAEDCEHAQQMGSIANGRLRLTPENHLIVDDRRHFCPKQPREATRLHENVDV
jgi:hypothetical protein